MYLQVAALPCVERISSLSSDADLLRSRRHDENYLIPGRLVGGGPIQDLRVGIGLSEHDGEGAAQRHPQIEIDVGELACED